MNMRLFFLVFFFIPWTASSVYGDAWTLDKTVKTAVEVSNLVGMEQLNAESARLDAVSADMGWYPTVSLSGRANVVSEVMEISLPFKNIRFGDYDSYDMMIGVNQLMYDGGRLRALEAASEEHAKMSVFQAEAAALAVEYQAKAAFFGVVMAEKTLDASRQSLLEANNHLRDVRVRQREGMALENDVLRARLRASQAEMDLEVRKTELEKAGAAFRKVTGLGADEDVTVTWKEGGVPKPQSPHLDTALRQRPEFRAFDSAASASEITAQTAHAGKLPTIGLYGTFNYGKPGLDMPANEWMHYFSGGIALNWRVWDWGITERTIEKALIERKRTLKRRDDFTREITRQMTDSAVDYNAAKKRKTLASEAADIARRQLELATVSYREGVLTETDYDNSHAMFTRAMLEESVAAISLWLAQAKIEYVLGIKYHGGTK